jgi:hypothetical protein
MRPSMLVTAVLVLTLARLATAQEWIEFANRQDRFTCNFPTQPKITETIYKSQHEADLPARIYSAAQRQSRFSVTVVDFNQAQRILTEKAKLCPAGAEPCLGGAGDEGHWKADIRGAIDYAAGQLMQRDAKITSFVWNVVDMVEGRQLQLTNAADKSRTYAGIYMHENRLYIIEGTVPAGYPEPALFQQSLGWLDENGVGLRYQTYYSNGFPPPPRVNRAGRGQGQGRIDAPDATIDQRR